MGLRLLTLEDIYEIVTNKGHHVDYPDGSTNTFRLAALAKGMGYVEIEQDVWIKEEHQ